MSYKALLTGALVLACAASAPAAIVFFDDFSGNSANFLNGTSPDTNTLGTNALATWSSTTVAGTTFQADGSIVSATGTNIDRGAWLDLGAGFMQANTTYTITLDFSNVTSSIVYFGFQNSTTPDLTTLGQTQGTLSVGGAIRNFSGTQQYRLVSGDGAETAGTGLTFSPTGTLTAIIQSNNLTDATVTVGSLTSATFNATSLQQLMLAFEDGNTAASGATLNSITIDATPVPEPSIALLGGLGLLGLLRRRRA